MRLPEIGCRDLIGILLLSIFGRFRREVVTVARTQAVDARDVELDAAARVSTLLDPDRIQEALLHLEYEKRVHTRMIELLETIAQQKQEGEVIVKLIRRLLLSAVVLVMALTITGAVAAQELEPVAGVTASSAWPYVAVLALLVIGVMEAVHYRSTEKLLNRYDEALRRKDVRDEGERKFMESSLTVQDWIKAVAGITGAVGGLNIPVLDKIVDPAADFLDAISDGKPNEPAEPVPAKEG